MNFEKEIITLLNKEVGGVKINLEIPKNPKFGDFSFPCFSLAEKFRENPTEIAKRIAKALKKPRTIKKIEVMGGYINFFINKSIRVRVVLKRILKERENYEKKPVRKKVLIEHTSINPNASPHIGRARNALIGDSLVRIFRFLGYKVDVHYWVNDVGKQVAMLVYGSRGKKVDFDDLLRIYVGVNKSLSKNPKVEKEIFLLLHKLEEGDKKTKKMFREVVKTCLNGQLNILSELGIKYDKFDYESEYLWNKEIDKILKRFEKTGKLFRDDENRIVLDQKEFNFAMKSQVLVLTRADGTSLYPLRDLIYSIEKMKQGENIVVLGEDQKLYFEQIGAALKILGYKAPRAVHYSFILLTDGKMSTRSGNVILLKDFMNEAVNKANGEIYKRYKKRDKKLAKIIGYGAIKFSILKVSNDKNVVFDWKKALDFEGESGPYLQYTYARASSILKKKKARKNVNFELLNKNEEIKLVETLGKFSDVINGSLFNLEPHIIANYAYELAKAFNEFYHNCKCVGVEEELENARLSLVTAFRYVIKNSLDLLGIDVSERM